MTETNMNSLVAQPTMHFSTNFPNSFHPSGIFVQSATQPSTSQTLNTSAVSFQPSGIVGPIPGVSQHSQPSLPQETNKSMSQSNSTSKGDPKKVKVTKVTDDELKNHPLYKNQLAQLEVCRGTNVSLSNKISRLEESLRILENKN